MNVKLRISQSSDVLLVIHGYILFKLGVNYSTKRREHEALISMLYIYHMCSKRNFQ